MSEVRAPLLERALWVIERHLLGDLSLPAIAQACGVSTFHLSRAFSEPEQTAETTSHRILSRTTAEA